jgi:ABC-type transport system involved in multi-copper enzyme maturation permease subunit
MSEVLDAGPPPASAGDRGDATPDRAGRASSGTWRVSWSGVRTVATLELRQRVRSTRWIVILAIWAALLVGLAAMIHFAVHRTYQQIDPGQANQSADSIASQQAGATMFGLTILLVLSLGALVAPALSATSVNGDRTAGVLATLQTTLLSPAEIALGKLAASWVTALALLAAASPVLAWAYLDHGTPVTRLLTCVVLLAITLLIVCAIGLGWSTVTARTTSSAVLTYLSVAFLGLGLPVLFALSLPLTQEVVTTTYTEYESNTAPPAGNGAPPTATCVERQQKTTVTHTERVWWILAANPYVVIADASPRPTASDNGDPLSGLRDGMREMRLGQDTYVSRCGGQDDFSRHMDQRRAQRDALGGTWPYGLAVDLAVGVAFTVVAVLRLRTPSGRLPRNVRVA